MKHIELKKLLMGTHSQRKAKCTTCIIRLILFKKKKKISSDIANDM